jgi:hypothetical protein
MAKLTDTQVIVLSKAAGREDGLAPVPDGLNKAAVSKVGASLVSDMPVWREDEEGRGTSLVITRAGRDAIGVEDGGERRLGRSSDGEERASRRTSAAFASREVDHP